MRLHNTLSGRVEEFKPRNDNQVLMYVCGITPYAESHLGHAMSYIIFDTLRRYLEYRGYDVKHVQNYTDIDDKLIARAENEGRSVEEIASEYSAQFAQAIDDLNVLPAHIYPRATQEIPAIVEIIEGLIEKGYAYAGPPKGVYEASDVYYRVEKKADYGKLAKRNLDSMLAGARIEPLEGKENPMDFTLWKSAKPGEPSWESPWGKGRPGWHIECSAMSYRHLGPQIDIHGGGLDLVFPHHENEIAQTEAFTGLVPFSNFWIHNGLLQLGDQKMSKSLGNLINMREAIDRYGGDAIRVFVLSSGYRSPLTYSEEALAAGKTGTERLRNAVETPDSGAGEPIEAAPYRERFITAMDDDLNTAQAMGLLFDLAREINRGRDAGRSASEAQSVLRELAGVLGLRLEASTRTLSHEVTALLISSAEKMARDLENDLRAAGLESLAESTDARLNEIGTGTAGAPFIELLIDLRKELREAKQYELADRIRDGLGELGIVLEDSAGGTTWKAK